MYAKCVRGHVLKNADDWLLCENLPKPDALCWQEGGQTLLTLGVRQREETQSEDASLSTRQENKPQTTRS